MGLDFDWSLTSQTASLAWAVTAVSFTCLDLWFFSCCQHRFVYSFSSSVWASGFFFVQLPDVVTPDIKICFTDKAICDSWLNKGLKNRKYTVFASCSHHLGLNTHLQCIYPNSQVKGRQQHPRMHPEPWQRLILQYAAMIHCCKGTERRWKLVEALFWSWRATKCGELVISSSALKPFLFSECFGKYN